MVAFITILLALIMIPSVLNWLWNRYNPVEQDKQVGEEVDEEFLTPTESENLLSPEEVEIIVGEIKQSLDDDSQGKKSDIRYSISFDESLLKPTFQEMLLDLINEKNVYHVDFYKAAWIDRKLFSAIMNNKNYKPKKTTAVACCLGLRLSLSEATKLMEAAGYSLSESILWDVIIKYCIEHEIYDINQVNQILDAHGEKCIGCYQIDKMSKKQAVNVDEIHLFTAFSNIGQMKINYQAPIAGRVIHLKKQKKESTYTT